MYTDFDRRCRLVLIQMKQIANKEQHQTIIEESKSLKFLRFVCHVIARKRQIVNLFISMSANIAKRIRTVNHTKWTAYNKGVRGHKDLLKKIQRKEN